MPELVLINVKQYVGGLDLSGSFNQHALVIDADAPEFTAFGDETREYKGGLLGAGSEHEGFFDGPVDDDLFTNVGAAARVATLAPTGDDGEIAYFFEQFGTNYTPGGQIGDAFSFSNSNQVTGLVTRGRLWAPGSQTGDDSGTARQLGAVTADEQIRAVLHVLDLQGASPTLDVTVESDDNSGMTSATTQLTFSQFTDVGGELQAADGAIADDWWRVTWDLGVDTDSALFVVAVGIA